MQASHYGVTTVAFVTLGAFRQRARMLVDQRPRARVISKYYSD